MKKNVIIGIIVAALLAAGIGVAVYLDGKTVEEHTDTSYAMGTVVTQKLWGKGSEQVATEIKRNIVYCENKSISRRVAASDISKLNSEKTFEVSDNTVSDLQKMLQFSKDCGGVVDITMGEVINLWNIGEGNFKVPAKDVLDKALKTVDYKKIKIDGNKITIGKDQRIDMGCAGKGIACDDAYKVLEKYTLKKAIISVGGSIVLWSKDSNEKFTVGIRDPKKDASSYAMTVETGKGFVSTSGSYERVSKDEKGKAYHHILSTENGYPVENGIVSATVFCQSGIMSDALSTACFILGPEKSEKLLEKYDAQAVFITKDNKVVLSKNFDMKIKIESKDYSVK